MRLADFITANSDAILAEWVSFARQSADVGRTMSREALRDHALAMLRTIVADLRTAQSDAEQEEKSKGNAEPAANAADTAAEVHGAGRAESGFTIAEMVSEYRALRASVIRLWSADSGTLTGADLKDLTRFNEAIDQALAESVSRFTQDLDRSKEMFIAILGQDLRAPLNAVTTGARDLLKGNLDEKQAAVTLSISRSGNRMNEMIDDLLDFTRGRLGSGLPIERADVDLGAVVLHAVDEMRAAHPDATLQMTSAGDLRGSWDGARVSQALTNLLGNAVQHGEPGAMISVTLQGEAREVVIRVHNHGVAIPASEIPHLFSPFTQSGSRVAQTPESTSLGLGLYIAERIVTAHGGSISVRSSGEAGTLFTTRLPR